MLTDAYAARRRRELGQLWLVIRHAQNGDEDNPDAVLPPGPHDTAAELDDDDGDPGFDAVALVRRARQNEGR